MRAMSFEYQRVVRFADTDAAGVVFFANYLKICHEAYEEVLAAAGVDVRRFFSAESGVIVPVVSSEAEYSGALRVGDRVVVGVSPKRLGESEFEVEFELRQLVAGGEGRVVAKAKTRHVCLDAETRRRVGVQDELAGIF